MSDKSAIEWTDATWNAVTGCTKVSQGCKNCYAEKLAKRLQAMGNPNYVNGFKVTLHPRMLELPRTWRSPRRVFVNSMSDLHHEDVPLEFVSRVYDVMDEVDRHVYQVLTKRPHRLAAFVSQRYGRSGAPAHIWLGTSVEDERVVRRIDELRAAPAAVRFLSCEPLIGRISSIGRMLAAGGIHWVITGGESGWKHRPFDPVWAGEIRDACVAHGVAYFHKQNGGHHPKAGGRELDGRTWSEFPSAPRFAFA